MLFSWPAMAASKTDTDCDNEAGELDKRICTETQISKQPFVLVPYKPNYFIGSYVDGLSDEVPDYQNFETKFQISFKIPLSDYEKPTRCLWIDNTRCTTFFGYTQISVWQMLNFDHSAPFRDTNFEPELMVAQLFNKDSDGSWDLRLINYGLVDHQSNGKVPPSSRSWNRSYIDFVFEKSRHYVTLKLWHRWKEAPKAQPTDFKGDDNVDIEKYVGNGELKYFYAGQNANFAIELRDSEKNANKANVQLNWSYPVKKLFSIFEDSNLRLYAQYYNGYGETLIDYNIKRERIGLGVMLTDWL
jgi:phospholipase A1